MAKLIDSSGQTQTGQPGPGIRLIDSGNNDRRPEADKVRS